MKMFRALAVFVAAFFAVAPVAAQWQVPDHSVPIGNGAGNTGFNFAAPGSAGIPLTSNAPGTDPTFHAIANAGLTPGAANTVKGSLDGTTLSDIALPACAADGLHALTYTGGVGWACTVVTAPVATALVPKTATVTISIATPAVVTWNGHGLADNAVVYFCVSTGGALPTPLVPCSAPTGGVFTPTTLLADPTLYYVKPGTQTTNTFQIASTPSGSAINTTGTQSGTITAFANVFVATGSVGETKFTVTQTSNGNVPSNADTIFATITLTPGVWRVGGSAGVFGASGTTFSTNHASYGYGITTICSSPYCGTMAWHVTTNSSNGVTWPFNETIIPVFTTGAVNAVCEPVFTVSTATCYGDLRATRIR